MIRTTKYMGWPELIKVISNIQSKLVPEVAYTYHILNTFAHVFHMRQRVLSYNNWAGWMRWMKSVFEQGTIIEISKIWK